MPPSSLFIILISLIFLIIWWFWWRESIGNPIPNTLMKKYASVAWEIRIIWMLRVGIFLIVMVLWIDPQISIEHTQKEETHKNIILTLDISNSMKTDDILPSRIEKAKAVIRNYLEKDDTSNIGYIIFAGRTFVMSPPTQDITALRELIASTTTDTIDQSQKDTSWTNIGDALVSGISTLIKSGTGEKIIILVTDGRANTGILPSIAADEAAKNNITIYTVGIGSSSGSVLSYIEGGIRKYFYDPAGNKVLADIDEPTLREIARKTGGRYFQASDEQLLESIFQDIRTLLSPPVRYITKTRTGWIWVYLCIGMALLMGLHSMLASKIRRKYKCV